MTKIKSILLVATFIMLAASGYGQTPKELITKKWVFKEIEKKDIDRMIAEQTKNYIGRLDTLTDSSQKSKEESELKEQIAKGSEELIKMFSDLIFEIKPDGTCETGGGKRKEKGKWELSKDGKKLSIISDKGNKQELEITQLTSDELTIGLPTGKESLHITFTKSKTPKEMIARKWAFKEIDRQSMDTITKKEDLKDRYPEISDSSKKADIEMQMKEQMRTITIETMEQICKGMTWDIKADGSCISSSMGKVETGTWELSADEKKLTMTDKERQGHFDVIKLTNDELSILMKKEGIEIEMVFTASK